MRMGPENRPGTPNYLRHGAGGRVKAEGNPHKLLSLEVRFIRGGWNSVMLTPAEVIERYGLPADRHQAEPK